MMIPKFQYFPAHMAHSTNYRVNIYWCFVENVIILYCLFVTNSSCSSSGSSWVKQCPYYIPRIQLDHTSQGHNSDQNDQILGLISHDNSHPDFSFCQITKCHNLKITYLDSGTYTLTVSFDLLTTMEFDTEEAIFVQY